MKHNEVAICGLPSVRARFQTNAASILRLFFDAPTARQVGVMSKALAAARKVYRCVEPAELAKIAGTVHHGGIVAIVSAPVLRAPLAKDLDDWAQRRSPVLVLDRIGNAHNLGALARSAAFFGVAHLVLPFSPEAALPGEAAYRVAEGGLEHVGLWRVPDLAAFAQQLAAVGYDVVGAATRGGQTAWANERPGQPVALVLGNEEHGLAPAVEQACTRRVTLAGSGSVESLNVSVAGAVLMWECFGRPRTERR